MSNQTSPQTTSSQLNTVSMSAVNPNTGEQRTVRLNQNWLYMGPEIALDIFQKTDYVFGVVAGRSNKLSGLNYTIKPAKREEERIATGLDELRELHSESNDPIEKAGYYLRAKRWLKDLQPDFVNFHASLRRWTRRIKSTHTDRAEQINDFLQKPNRKTYWSEYVKQITQDMLIHGRGVSYKGRNIFGRINALHIVAGGTVFPVESERITDDVTYLQTSGLVGANEIMRAELYTTRQLSYMTYMPNSLVSKGMTPLDALINKISGHLSFDEYMARQSDGDSPVEKILVYGKDGAESVAGQMDTTTDFSKADIQRKEIKLNRTKRDNAIAVITGKGMPQMFDVSKRDLVPSQMAYQEEVKKAVGLVFNASNLELNETGSSGTSGRSTSEAQMRQDNQRGTRPLTVAIETFINHEVLPELFIHNADDYIFEFEAEVSEEERIKAVKGKADSGIWTKNEIRLAEGLEHIDGHDELGETAGSDPDNQQLLNSIDSIQRRK